MTADVFAAYELSGLWDAPTATWKRAVDMCQRQEVGGVPVSFGMHTEATRDQVEAAFKHQPGHWGYVRMDEGNEEIVATFDRDLWEVKRARAIVMSNITIKTKKGFTQPLTRMLEVVADYKPTGRRCYLEGMHWPLRNTPKRAQSWALCEDRVQAHWARILERDDDALIFHFGDINESVRNPTERARVLKLVSSPPGMHQSWDLRNLPKRGTHGPLAIIDNGLTNARIVGKGAVLLPRVPKFDHGPFGCAYRAPALNAAHHAAREVVTPKFDTQELQVA